MYHNAFDLVDHSAFETCDPELTGVGYPIYKFLVLVGLFIELKSLQVGYQYLGTSLYLNLLGAHLFGEALLTLKLVRLVKQLLAREPLDAVIERRVLLDV